MKVDTVRLKLTAEQALELERIALHTSLLWNEANYQRRQAFLNKKKMPNYSTQCKYFKHSENFKAIGTGKSQAVLKKLHEAWRSFWTLKRLQLSEGSLLPPNIKRVGMPGYLKDRHTGQTVIRGFHVRNDCYSLDRERSTITISKTLRLRYRADRVMEGRRKVVKKIKGKGKGNRKGKEKLGRLDVMYDRLNDAWYAFIPVDISAPVQKQTVSIQPRKEEKVGSIDLGICNLVAFYSENEQPLIYSGRAVLSDYVYRTKKIAQLQSKLPADKRRHTSRKIGLFYCKRTRHFTHAIRAMLKDLFKG